MVIIVVRLVIALDVGVKLRFRPRIARFDLHVVKLDLPALKSAHIRHGTRPDGAGGRKRRAKYLVVECKLRAANKPGPPWEADESPGFKRALREGTYKVHWCSGNGGDEYLHVNA